MLAVLRGIVVETISGALVGALMGAIVGLQGEHLQLPLFLGLGIGAALGMLVGVSRLQWVQHSFPDQAPEEWR